MKNAMTKFTYEDYVKLATSLNSGTATPQSIAKEYGVSVESIHARVALLRQKGVTITWKREPGELARAVEILKQGVKA